MNHQGLIHAVNAQRLVAHGRQRRHWVAIVGLVTVLHVIVVLALVLSPVESHPRLPDLQLVFSCDEPVLVIDAPVGSGQKQEEPQRESAATLELAGGSGAAGLASSSLKEEIFGAAPAFSPVPMLATFSEPDVIRTIEAGSLSLIARDAASTLGDAPLEAGPTGTAIGNGVVGGSGAAGNGAGSGSGSQTGSGLSGAAGQGKGIGTGSGGAGGQSTGGRVRPAVVLSGTPVFPISCRRGLCRGHPCEGTSVWLITVPSSGGPPQKIDCPQPMDCALQNASIRSFFEKQQFPKTERATAYKYTVPMIISGAEK